MKNWTYFDPTATIVFREIEDGRVESCLVSALPPETTVLPYAAPLPVIVPVDAGQIRRALTHVGLRAPLEAAIANGTQDLKDYYQYSNMFVRTHPLVIEMGATLGASSNDLDNLWLLAATL